MLAASLRWLHHPSPKALSLPVQDLKDVIAHVKPHALIGLSGGALGCWLAARLARDSSPSWPAHPWLRSLRHAQALPFLPSNTCAHPSLVT